MDTYTVEAGRLICKNGEPFIAIGRVGGTSPVAADKMAMRIGAWLQGEALSKHLQNKSKTKQGRKR